MPFCMTHGNECNNTSCRDKGNWAYPVQPNVASADRLVLDGREYITPTQAAKQWQPISMGKLMDAFGSAYSGGPTVGDNKVKTLVRKIRRLAFKGTITTNREKAELAADILELCDEILEIKSWK